MVIFSSSMWVIKMNCKSYLCESTYLDSLGVKPRSKVPDGAVWWANYCSSEIFTLSRCFLVLTEYEITKRFYPYWVLKIYCGCLEDNSVILITFSFGGWRTVVAFEIHNIIIHYELAICKPIGSLFWDVWWFQCFLQLININVSTMSSFTGYIRNSNNKQFPVLDRLQMLALHAAA